MRPRHVLTTSVAAGLAVVTLGACSASATTVASVRPSTSVVGPRTMTPGDHVVTVTAAGRVRTLIVHVPPNPPVAQRPLILVYHGAEDTAANTAKQTDFEKVADQFGEVVAFMQGYQNTWNEGAGHTPAEQAHVDDVAFTTAAITKLETLITFNHKRIVATGFSNGALMVEYLGCRLAKKLELIVPVEGQLPVSVAQHCAPTRAISVYEIHGTADAAIPYGGGPFNGVGGGTTVLSAPKSVQRWAALDHCGATPSTTYPTSGITLTTYSKCSRSVTATLRTIRGGTHQWGSQIAVLVTEALSI